MIQPRRSRCSLPPSHPAVQTRRRGRRLRRPLTPRIRARATTVRSAPLSITSALDDHAFGVGLPWQTSIATAPTIAAASNSSIAARSAPKPPIACACAGTGRGAIPPITSGEPPYLDRARGTDGHRRVPADAGAREHSRARRRRRLVGRSAGRRRAAAPGARRSAAARVGSASRASRSAPSSPTARGFCSRRCTGPSR